MKTKEISFDLIVDLICKNREHGKPYSIQEISEAIPTLLEEFMLQATGKQYWNRTNILWNHTDIVRNPNPKLKMTEDAYKGLGQFLEAVLHLVGRLDLSFNDIVLSIATGINTPTRRAIPLEIVPDNLTGRK